MAAAVVIICLAAAGLLVSTLLIAREQSKTRDAYNLEQKKSMEASRERATAQRNFQQARDSVDYFTRIAAEEMADNPVFNDVRREMLEESLVYYQDFLEEQSGNTPLGAELTATRSKISALLGELATADALARSGYRIALLSEPAVREELELSADQSARADQLSTQWHNGPPDARRIRAKHYATVAGCPPGTSEGNGIGAGRTAFAEAVDEAAADRLAGERTDRVQRSDALRRALPDPPSIRQNSGRAGLL